MSDTQTDTSVLGDVLKAVESSAQRAQDAGKPLVQAASDNDPNNDPTELTPTWYWIKDSNGNGSIMATLTFVAFWITTIAYVLSMFEKIGPIAIRPFDVAACATYFIPIMSAFLGKHVVDAKFGNKTNQTGA